MRVCARRISVCVLVFFCPLAAFASDPATEFEKFIGNAVAYALRETSGTTSDPLLLSWVKRIGATVSAQSPRKNIPYTFEILTTDVPNASAMPGGHIFVTRGLLDTIESDDDLACVLAHETGHVAKRHALQQIGGNLLILSLLSTLKGDKYDTLKTGGYVLNVFRTLHKSREMEAQADDEGLRFAFDAGYNAGGLLHFLDSIGGSEPSEPSQLEQYFDTHPTPQKRVAFVKRSLLVTRPTVAEREKTAAGYEARGLEQAARAVRNGRDPFYLPPLPYGLPQGADAELSASREQLSQTQQHIRRDLTQAWKARRVGGDLQSLLVLNPTLHEPRWALLVARAVAVQAGISDVYAGMLQTVRVAPGTFDALTRSEFAAPGDEAVQMEATRGRDEVRLALRKLDGAPQPLGRAANTVAAVFGDLNNRFYRPKGNAAWLRYGTLEAMLRYAESELARANKQNKAAWRLLSVARVRRYQLRLSELVPQNEPARRALWHDLTQRRLGADFGDGDNLPTGEATVRAALAVETWSSLLAVQTGRGTATWADWVGAKNGVPENVATVLRLLTLDLERETFGETGTNQ